MIVKFTILGSVIFCEVDVHLEWREKKKEYMTYADACMCVMYHEIWL